MLSQAYKENIKCQRRCQRFLGSILWGLVFFNTIKNGLIPATHVIEFCTGKQVQYYAWYTELSI